jgi:HD-like signal output (HDOD) protein
LTLVDAALPWMRLLVHSFQVLGGYGDNQGVGLFAGLFMIHESGFAGLPQWVRFFRDADFPVLAQSAAALEELRAAEESVDANSIAEAFRADPLMTLKILAYASTHRSSRLVTDTETVTATVIMMGIGPFFRAFGPQQSIDQQLNGNGEALEGLFSTIRRAHRASVFALGFAVHRRQDDAVLIHLAALLHDFAEMLLWCHFPRLALRIRDDQAANKSLRSGAAQQAVLAVTLGELQQALMKAWHLPDLLIRISDDAHAEHPSVSCVLLAIRLARHTAQGWDNPAIPDDLKEIGALLSLSGPATLDFVRGLDM